MNIRPNAKFVFLSLLLVTLFFSACSGREAVSVPNEAEVISLVERLAVAQGVYFKQHRTFEYGTFDQLNRDVALDARFTGDGPVVSGYVFTMKVTPRRDGNPAFFSINADPRGIGGRHFYVDASDNSVKVNAQRPAGPEDPRVVSL